MPIRDFVAVGADCNGDPAGAAVFGGLLVGEVYQELIARRGDAGVQFAVRDRICRGLDTTATRMAIVRKGATRRKRQDCLARYPWPRPIIFERWDSAGARSILRRVTTGRRS